MQEAAQRGEHPVLFANRILTEGIDCPTLSTSTISGGSAKFEVPGGIAFAGPESLVRS